MDERMNGIDAEIDMRVRSTYSVCAEDQERTDSGPPRRGKTRQDVTHVQGKPSKEGSARIWIAEGASNTPNFTALAPSHNH